MSLEFRDEGIDPLLAASYAELREEGTPEVDWDRLRQSINRRAEPLISRKKVRKLVRYTRPIVPLAIAASLAFGLWVGPEYVRERITPDPAAVAVEMDAEEILSHAVDHELSDEDFQRVVTGRENPEALLVSAMSDY